MCSDKPYHSVLLSKWQWQLRERFLSTWTNVRIKETSLWCDKFYATSSAAPNFYIYIFFSELFFPFILGWRKKKHAQNLSRQDLDWLALLVCICCPQYLPYSLSLHLLRSSTKFCQCVTRKNTYCLYYVRYWHWLASPPLVEAVLPKMEDMTPWDRHCTPSIEYGKSQQHR